MTRENTKSKMGLDTKSLVLLGLSDNEILLYSNMLQMQRTTVRQLGTLGLFPRTMLYHVLNQLVSNGLVIVQEIPGKKTVFVTKDPENLYDLLHKKEQEFQTNTDRLKDLIPKLKNKFILFGKVPNIRIFNGILEYEQALEDIFISKVDSIYSYEDFIGKKAGIEVRTNFENRRLLKKIKKQTIFFESKDSLQKLVEIKYSDYSEYRSLSGDVQEFETDIILYANKILYTIHNGHEPSAVLIEDENLLKMQKFLFSTLWNSGKNRTLYYTEVARKK